MSWPLVSKIQAQYRYLVKDRNLGDKDWFLYESKLYIIFVSLKFSVWSSVGANRVIHWDRTGYHKGRVNSSSSGAMMMMRADQEGVPECNKVAVTIVES